MSLLRRSLIKLTGHVSDIVGSVQLHKESVGITELERFLRPARLWCQITRLQFGRRLICVKAGDSEVVVIESRPTVLLFDSEEALPYSQYVRLLRMLFQGHTEQLLIELRCALNIGDPYRDMVQAYGAHTGLAWGGLRASDQCGQRRRELAPA